MKKLFLLAWFFVATDYMVKESAYYMVQFGPFQSDVDCYKIQHELKGRNLNSIWVSSCWESRG